MSTYGIDNDIFNWHSPSALFSPWEDTWDTVLFDVEDNMNPDAMGQEPAAPKPIAWYNEKPFTPNFRVDPAPYSQIQTPVHQQPHPGMTAREHPHFYQPPQPLNPTAMQLQQPHHVLPQYQPSRQESPAYYPVASANKTSPGQMGQPHISPPTLLVNDVPMPVKSEQGNNNDSDEYIDGSDVEYEDTNTPSKRLADGEPFKLASSRSPVIEAFVHCALRGWGVELKKCSHDDVEFTVTDFDYYYRQSSRICSKHRPTEDISSRLKGLKRWLPDFPARKSLITGPFNVSVAQSSDKVKKIREMLQRNRELAGIRKIRKSR